MKNGLLLGLLIIVGCVGCVASAAEYLPAEVLITGCGKFALAADLTLEISADEEGYRYLILNTGHNPAGVPSTIGDSGSLGSGPKFFFCWQPDKRRLYWATAESLNWYDYLAFGEAEKTCHSLRTGRISSELPELFSGAVNHAFPR